MNKRIKELAEQAGFQSYITTHAEDVAMFEKFAMLVIQDYENDVRESRREVMSELGYSRIGLRNI